MLERKIFLELGVQDNASVLTTKSPTTSCGGIYLHNVCYIIYLFFFTASSQLHLFVFLIFLQSFH
jgi:hypothetical protein